MKVSYNTTATLNREQLFAVLKESIEKKTGKQLANIYWEDTDSGMCCTLHFCEETVELKE